VGSATAVSSLVSALTKVYWVEGAVVLQREYPLKVEVEVVRPWHCVA
jgi:hypothetical protein